MDIKDSVKLLERNLAISQEFAANVIRYTRGNTNDAIVAKVLMTSISVWRDCLTNGRACQSAWRIFQLCYDQWLATAPQHDSYN